MRTYVDGFISRLGPACAEAKENMSCGDTSIQTEAKSVLSDIRPSQSSPILPSPDPKKTVPSLGLRVRSQHCASTASRHFSMILAYSCRLAFVTSRHSVISLWQASEPIEVLDSGYRKLEISVGSSRPRVLGREPAQALAVLTPTAPSLSSSWERRGPSGLGTASMKAH